MNYWRDWVIGFENQWGIGIGIGFGIGWSGVEEVDLDVIRFVDVFDGVTSSMNFCVAGSFEFK